LAARAAASALFGQGGRARARSRSGIGRAAAAAATAAGNGGGGGKENVAVDYSEQVFSLPSRRPRTTISFSSSSSQRRLWWWWQYGFSWNTTPPLNGAIWRLDCWNWRRANNTVTIIISSLPFSAALDEFFGENFAKGQKAWLELFPPWFAFPARPTALKSQGFARQTKNVCKRSLKTREMAAAEATRKFGSLRVAGTRHLKSYYVSLGSPSDKSQTF
jgi:hypothetical protein